MIECKIGIIGMGTVGSGVLELIQKNKKLIEKRSNISLTVKSVCDLTIQDIEIADSTIIKTDNWQDLINDDEINIIVELIGGIEPARSILIGSMAAKKHVVTANKKLLAEAGKDIFMTAEESSMNIGFEAAVGGGIPCILGLRKGLVGNQIDSVMGILNGTTNYILSKMDEEQMTFGEVLDDAQQLGFAESDPTFDVEGFDAGHKISLLSMLAFNSHIDFPGIPIEGISKLRPIDFEFAKDMGYTVKLLGIANKINNDIDIRVHPTMIHNDHPLASVRNENNAVFFNGDMTGPVIMYGKGAGSLPTASAVVSDIIQIARGDMDNIPPITIDEKANLLDVNQRSARYYLRIHTKDTPGILAAIAGELGNHGISISGVMQREMDEDVIPLIILTHEAIEGEMLKAIEEIQTFDFVAEDIMLIRIEDSRTGERHE